MDYLQKGYVDPSVSLPLHVDLHVGPSLRREESGVRRVPCSMRVIIEKLNKIMIRPGLDQS
eukprot:3731630-Prymnesium_polylepis.3